MAPRTHRSDHRSTARLAGAVLLLAAILWAVHTPATANAATPSPPFPRLAVWWPDPAHQSLADIARCDWIALQASDADKVATLRALNPDAYILAPTAARELNYRLGSYNDPLNVELRSASTDWMLTQVGATLTADVTASSTSFPVSDTHRFAVGEMALVDNELVHIDSVGPSALQVTRGQLDAPSPHLAGSRIASVVSHWPNSIAMDLSSQCPTRDVGYGPETWADWNVRRAQRVLATGDWDGLLIDGYEGNISWMVSNGEDRSIDLWRTNQPTTDGYAKFNDAWNAGAVAYGNELRAAFPDKILVGNGNLRCYALNGTVFEGFPYSTLPTSWWDYIFVGPYGFPRASYPEWMANAATPNLTLVQTYGSATDYRGMRFGLCSALLGDGYFSYAKSSTGHAVSGLYWFDEFDDAGAGRGYLGQPLRAKVKAGAAWRRDFQGGVALVNPSGSSVTVKLGGTFRRIKGKQDPAVNSGALVTSVTLRSRDGVILLRVPKVVLRPSVLKLTSGGSASLRVAVSPAIPASVRFRERRAGSSTWHTVTNASLDATGTATIARSPRVSTQYQAVTVGTGAASGIVTVAVKPIVTMRSSSYAVGRGTRVRFSGTVSYPGRVTVRVQRRLAGSWKTVSTVTTSGGAFSARVVCASRGAFTYRAYVPGGVSHLAAASGSVLIAVR